MSDSLTEDDLAPWTDTTTIVRRADAHRAIAELKDQPGKDILMFGSRTLRNDLLVAGLVDLESISLLWTYGEARALALRDVWIPGADTGSGGTISCSNACCSSRHSKTTE